MLNYKKRQKILSYTFVDPSVSYFTYLKTYKLKKVCFLQLLLFDNCREVYFNIFFDQDFKLLFCIEYNVRKVSVAICCFYMHSNLIKVRHG